MKKNKYNNAGTIKLVNSFSLLNPFSIVLISIVLITSNASKITTAFWRDVGGSERYDICHISKVYSLFFRIKKI